MTAAALPQSPPRKALWLCLALGLLIALAAPVRADSMDPPARVGRIAEVLGDAWLFDTENKEWTRVTRNQTVGEGDRLRTDERARVSLRIGSASLWLDERSDLEFSQLDEGRVLLQLDKGDLGLRLRAQDVVGDYRVQTREGLVLPERDGLYRVEQLDRGSRAYVWQGRLRFEAGRGGDVPPVLLQAGEQAEFWWAGGPRVERQRIEGDEFGDWMLAQSQREGDGLGSSQRYVSAEMTGAEDLDRNGRWEQAAEFGSVWIPYQVAPDWAPYRNGRWVWTRNWGWSWVDDAAWGFAPFHYGRWVQWGGRWCWAPGRYVARPVYAPALVAWVGGPVVAVSIGIGQRPPPPRYGWYPLAPREPYVPSYRHTHTYEQRLNRDPDPVTVPRPHRNRDVPGAISYLPGQGGPVRPMPVTEQRPVRPLPAPPARNELAGQLPARPFVESQGPRAPADLAWRSENRGRRERGAEREPQRTEQPGFQAVQPHQPTVVQPPRPAEVQQPQPQLPPQQQQAPTWRGRERDREPVRAQPERAQEREQERGPSRGFDRGGNDRVGPGRPPGFERQAEMPPQPRPAERPRQAEMPAQPMPMPQAAVRPPVEVARPPAPQPQPAQQAKPEERGPQRGGRPDRPRQGEADQR